MKTKTLLSLAMLVSFMLALMPALTPTLTFASPEVGIKAKPAGSTYNATSGRWELEGPPPGVCENFIVTLEAQNLAIKLWSWGCDFEWNPAVLECVGVTEGPFLKNVGSTLFPPPFINNFLGKIPDMGCTLMIEDGALGTGDLAYLEFHVKAIGESNLNITHPSFLDIYSGSITIDSVQHGYFKLPPPPPTPPDAAFTPAHCTFVYVCDNITLDGRASTPGWDTLPAGHVCPITDYRWDIHFPNCTTITLHGDYIPDAFHCDGPGDVDITLTVNATDTNPPGAGVFAKGWETNSETHTIHQILKPVGAAIDVKTDRGGEGPGYKNVTTGEQWPPPAGWSDAYGPQEEVTVCAKVTYNDEPVEYKPVAFEAIDPNGTSRVYRTAFTDANGIACVKFRIPWEGTDANRTFGIWEIIGTVDIAGDTVKDIVKFYFGWIAEIKTVTVSPGALKKCNTLSITVTIYNLAFTTKWVYVTIVLYDECGVPICRATAWVELAPRTATTITLTNHIPMWAFVGTARAYANVFSDQPKLGGTPMCPEKYAIFTILKTA